MTEVLLNTDELVILGPPEEIELFLDIGAQGIRGSKIFSGTGIPSGTTIGSETAQVGDYYINTALNTAEYAYMYELTSVPPNSLVWTPRLRINPKLYSNTYTVDFTSESTRKITIPFSSIASNITTYTASQFNVQYSIIDSNSTPLPIASSIKISKVGTTTPSLEILINGASFDGTDWDALTGNYTVHVFVSLMEA